jgi:biopolymer transport protein ExbD
MSLRARRRARQLSLTSLIDVIFLLLLFFMLTSTFSRFAETELASAGAASQRAPRPAEDRQVFFLRLSAEGVNLNGTAIELDDLVARIEEDREPGPAALLLSVAPDVTAQLLTDALAAATGLRGVPVTVLEAS